MRIQINFFQDVNQTSHLVSSDQMLLCKRCSMGLFFIWKESGVRASTLLNARRVWLFLHSRNNSRREVVRSSTSSWRSPRQGLAPELSQAVTCHCPRHHPRAAAPALLSALLPEPPARISWIPLVLGWIPSPGSGKAGRGVLLCSQVCWVFFLFQDYSKEVGGK